MLRALCHTDGSGWSEVIDLREVSELRASHGHLVWAEADVSTLTGQDLRTIADEFGLHALAIEDAANTRQRPKLERFDDHWFAVVHQLDERDGQLEAAQLACFIGVRYTLVLHAGAHRMMGEVRRRLGEAPPNFRIGAAYLLHTIVDAVVDDYQSIADELEEQIEGLEERVLGEPTERVEREVYRVKQRIARFRRYALPIGRQLEAIVQPGAVAFISDDMAHYFRDVHDHALRIADQVRSVDDLASAVLDLQRAAQANALNQVTKRLTGWAAIIAVPTFIASVYGMNFALFPPEGSREGFFVALGLMVTVGVLLFLWFRRRDWI